MFFYRAYWSIGIHGILPLTAAGHLVGEDGDQAAEHDVSEHHLGHDQHGSHRCLGHDVPESERGGRGQGKPLFLLVFFFMFGFLRSLNNPNTPQKYLYVLFPARRGKTEVFHILGVQYLLSYIRI